SMHVPAELVIGYAALPAPLLYIAAQLQNTSAGCQNHGEYQIGNRIGQHTRGMAQDNIPAPHGIKIKLVDTDRYARNHLQSGRLRQQCFVQRVAGTYHALRVRQRIEKSLLLTGNPRIGNHDIVLEPYSRQLVGGKIAVNQDMFPIHRPACSSSRRVGRPSVSPTTWTARAPIQAPRSTAGRKGIPSSKALITPAAKPSPAPTVSTTVCTGTPAT